MNNVRRPQRAQQTKLGRVPGNRYGPYDPNEPYRGVNEEEEQQRRGRDETEQTQARAHDVCYPVFRRNTRMRTAQTRLTNE